MSYTPPGSRRARERSGRRPEEFGNKRTRMERRGRSQFRHHPFPEFDTGDARMEGPSYLSFQIVERVEQEPLGVRRFNHGGEPEGSSEVVRRASSVEEESAVSPTTEPIVSPNAWTDSIGLRICQSKLETIRSDGAEVVMPYRWPAYRRKNESQEEYESRLAEYELETFLNLQESLTTIALEKVRAKQRRAMKDRKKPVLRKEDMESREPTPRAQLSFRRHPMVL
ncbi:uncharacterized protein LOC122500009 [Leptopilina heterotoma]|uniref:uncharacterized protein LOC122500009 n=1 Tax=Leptopilina heterotoma TaxID=63436 RepID=UPI001CA9D080|nr:uncharacterized protein LOC122500009 [Leptopilina heterotoma]